MWTVILSNYVTKRQKAGGRVGDTCSLNTFGIMRQFKCQTRMQNEKLGCPFQVCLTEMKGAGCEKWGCDCTWICFLNNMILCNGGLLNELWIEFVCFPHSSVGKESACNAGDPGLIPGSGRSAGEGIDYPLQYSWASLVAQLVKKPPARWETWVQSLGWEDPLETGKAIHSSILAWRITWTV